MNRQVWPNPFLWSPGQSMPYNCQLALGNQIWEYINLPHLNYLCRTIRFRSSTKLHALNVYTCIFIPCYKRLMHSVFRTNGKTVCSTWKMGAAAATLFTKRTHAKRLWPSGMTIKEQFFFMSLPLLLGSGRKVLENSSLCQGKANSIDS